MRLSIFRQKSNTGSANGSPAPTSPKKGRRLSQMLSPTRFKSDSSDQPSNPPSPLEGLPQADRQTTSAPLNPLNSPENTPPSSRQLNQFSSDGPPLPTSEPHNSFYSSSNFEPSALPASMNQPFASQEHNPTDLQSPAPDHRPLPSHEEHTLTASHSLPDPSEEHQGPSGRSISQPAHAALSAQRGLLPPNTSTSLSQSQRQLPAARPRTLERPQLAYQEEDQLSYGDSSFSESLSGHRLSSPSAAAAQRSKLRAASYNSRRSGLSSSALRASVVDNAPSRRLLPFDSEPSRVSSKHLVEKRSGQFSGQLDGNSDSAAERLPSKRPVYLQSHQASQRSSDQSHQSRDSEVTVGAEDSTITGGLTPGGISRLSRLSSFGSLASTNSEGTEVVGKQRSRSSTTQPIPKGNLDRVAENPDDRPSSQHTTPRAKQILATDPSDTVLAQHVRNIEVPETVVREYKASQRTGTSDSRIVTPSPFRALGKNNLSLKEQNAKIDKLTKENFDLKLKIHFLYQALGERSDEGVRDMISRNAQLQADLVSVKKENQALRKRVRLLEKQHNGDSGSVAPSHLDSEDGSRSLATAQLEEEVGYLQQRMLDLEHENAQLAGESQYQELCTRLDEEFARREQAERLVRNLQAEMQRLKNDQSSSSRLRIRSSNGELGYARPRSRVSHTSGQEGHDNDSLSGNTLVEQLRKENEMLKRDLGAQASMLTSRNREKDRLQQEIEAIKLMQRRGERLGPDSNAGDSILDRSVSRAQNRSVSRASGSTRESQLSEPERDRYEITQAILRDENSMLKMQLQDAERELSVLGDGAEHIRGLQEEHEDALQALRDADADMEYLTEEIRQLERMLVEKDDDITDLNNALRQREEDAERFRVEFQAINDSFNSVVDESEANQATIQSLQQDLSAANGELEAMETNLRDMTAAKERLEVQQESSQSEINFLRDEQEGDKIKIGNLQSALRNAATNQTDGEARVHEFEGLERGNAKAREDARQLRTQLQQRDADIKTLRNELTDATATLEEAMGNFDSTKVSYNEELAHLQQEVGRLMEELDGVREAHDVKLQTVKSHEASLESSSHEVRRLNELLEKERQGRKHDQNEFDRALNRAKGTPEAKFIELEKARALDRSKIDELKQNLDLQLKTRDQLLHASWNRLASICNSESITEQQQLLNSSSDVSRGLSTLSRQIPATLDALAFHIQSFRGKIDKTERETLEDFRLLSEALAERTNRLDRMEQAMSKQQSSDTSGSSADKFARLREENRLLRRELRYLKQGSFALPGLPTPGDDIFDQRANLTDARVLSTTSLGDGIDSAADGVPSPSPLVYHGPRSKEKAKSRHSMAHGTSMLLRAHSANEADEVLHRSEGKDLQSISGTHLPVTATARGADDATQGDAFKPPSDIPRSGLEAPRIPQRSASSDMTAIPTHSSERTWVWKLEEVLKRLRVEREERLLDRKAARERIVQGEKERDDLKLALRREKEKARVGNAVSDEAGEAATLAQEDAPDIAVKTNTAGDGDRLD